MKFYNQYAIEIHNTLLNLCQLRDVPMHTTSKDIKILPSPPPYDFSCYVPYLLQHPISSGARSALCLDLKKKLPIESIELTEKGFLNMSLFPIFWAEKYEGCFKELKEVSFSNLKIFQDNDTSLNSIYYIIQQIQILQKYMLQVFKDPFVFLEFSRYALYLTNCTELAMIKRIIFFMESSRKCEREYLIQEMILEYDAWWHSLKEKSAILRFIDPEDKTKSQARYLLLEGIVGVLKIFLQESAIKGDSI
jgi:hypothetical protein